MAAKYVTITRQQFEDWLFEQCPVFERVEDTAGVYLVPVSSCVAIQISTTLSSSDRNTGKGEGRCRMKFVNRHGRRTLHVKHDRRNCNRTQGWRENWRESLQEMVALFKKHRERYTELALMSQPEYAAEWTERIEAVEGWEGIGILSDLHRKLGEGIWLTPKQERAVWKFVRPSPRRGGSRGARTKAKKAASSPMTEEQRCLLVAVKRLEVEAQEADDDWLLGFCDSLGRRLRSGRDLTKRQREILDEKLKRFTVKIPRTA